jgi:hypothetical protein
MAGRETSRLFCMLTPNFIIQAKAGIMEQDHITPELRKKMNRTGIVFFILAVILVGYLTRNFQKEYDPSVREEVKAQKIREKMDKAEKLEPVAPLPPAEPK